MHLLQIGCRFPDFHNYLLTSSTVIFVCSFAYLVLLTFFLETRFQFYQFFFVFHFILSIVYYNLFNAFFGPFFQNLPALQKIWVKTSCFLVLRERPENYIGQPKTKVDKIFKIRPHVLTNFSTTQAKF